MNKIKHFATRKWQYTLGRETMSVTSSMWTGVSGLLAHGEKMNVIGNNIANVNTIGFKSQRMDFSDLMYVDQYNNGGLNQVGHGVQVQTIITSFTQGAYESTTNPTDLAINGSGFFQVRQEGTDQMYYTRAGNFTFDKEGNLTDPNNYILQGWKIENTGGIVRSTGGLTADSGENESAVLGTGAPQDVKLDAWTVQPFATTYMDFIPNLSATKGEDKRTDTSNPFTGLMNAWDGTQPPATENTPPIPMEGYSYQTTMEVYDEAGVTHNVTVYYDKVDESTYEGGENGGSMWEYIVTMEPAEDKRQYWDSDTNSLVDMSSTKMAGMLAAGTISFDSAGQASNQSCYTLFGDSNPDSNPTDFHDYWDVASGEYKSIPIMEDPNDLENWQSAEVSANGYPVVVANFTGILDAQTSGSPKGDDYGIELNFGMKASNISSPWNPSGSLADLTVDPYAVNPNYHPEDASSGPEYFLINEDYDSSLAKALNEVTDDAEDAWDAIGFQRWDNGKLVDYSFADYLNGVYTPAATDATVAAAETAWDALSFTKDDGAGNDVPFSFDEYVSVIQNQSQAAADAMITGGGTAAQAQGIYGSLATGVAADAATVLTNMDAAANALAYTDEDLNNSFKYTLDIPATTANVRDVLTAIYNEANGTHIDLNIYEGTDPSNATDLSTFTKPVIKEDNAVQSNAGESATYSQSQNGYGFGNLSSYYVDEKGVLAGVYSNGVTMELYQIVMYDFTSTQNLRREGGNVYSQTLESGDPKSGPAGVAGLGTISSGVIEQSNVDMAREFVLMITTQRGYQGNSKVITTADSMLETVIGLVR